jgi:hypothetical protein
MAAYSALMVRQDASACLAATCNNIRERVNRCFRQNLVQYLTGSTLSYVPPRR